MPWALRQCQPTLLSLLQATPWASGSALPKAIISLVSDQRYRLARFFRYRAKYAGHWLRAFNMCSCRTVLLFSGILLSFASIILSNVALVLSAGECVLPESRSPRRSPSKRLGFYSRIRAEKMGTRFQDSVSALSSRSLFRSKRGSAKGEFGGNGW